MEKINAILPRHDLRERHHQRRQGNADNGLRGQAIRFRPLSGRRACPPSPRLERVLYRDDASLRASATLRSAPTSTSARVEAAAPTLTTWAPRCAPRAALPTSRSSRCRGRSEVDACPARSQRQGWSNRLARAAGTPSSMPVNKKGPVDDYVEQWGDAW